MGFTDVIVHFELVTLLSVYSTRDGSVQSFLNYPSEEFFSVYLNFYLL